ncbi:Meckel syndrome type 1 protein-like [Daphnia pulex]|uniref:Meckel syndrome type 1 protein-like n=1 Tax=Daphnia pulex TaxID=6669 RepID=UPI001EDCA57D|nr:Meckel syndrome type 1 protein-like [Daphnia pulex]
MSSTKVIREPNNIFAENIKPDRIRHVVNVTIETAKEFHNCNHLYVRYVVDAPADWILAEPKNLHGVTHQSRAGNDSSNHFGHRFTLDVSKSWQHSSSSETPDLIPTPLLLLEVYDVNMWNRQKSVGYGFTHVPLTPGSYSIAIPTWRPYITETSLQLREYFLGLAPQIENIKYAGIPNDNHNNESPSVLGRFPLGTETSGSVQVRFDTMIQRGRNVLEQEQIRASINLHRPSATSTAVEQVIQTYHRAKQRLKAAHDALLG